jgi:phosphatidylglycerophosphate synthase
MAAGGAVARAQVPTAATQAGPIAGLAAQLLLLAVLARTVGLSAAGLVVGVGCAGIVTAALASGISRYRTGGLSPADWVTLARVSLAVGAAALVADSYQQSVPLALLVALTATAVALDAVDGWIARRTSTGPLGAKFDGEADAFLILILSVYVARTAGAWVLAIGAARYLFLAAEWALPWMRKPLPPRYWRKVVAATQGIVLAIAASHVLPRGVSQAALAGALILLAESFGRDVWWLWGRRGMPARVEVETAPAPHGRARRIVGIALTVIAVLVVWVALVVPDDPTHFGLVSFLRVPLEGLVLIAVALALPPRGRRFLAWIVGPVLALVVLLKILNLGFYVAFDRAFDPYQDLSYASIGAETLRSSVGGASAHLIIAGIVAMLVTVLLLMTFAVRRVVRVASGNRRWSLRVVAGLGGVWIVCGLFGAHFVSRTPIATANAAGLVANEAHTLQADINGPATFAKEISKDSFRNTPADQLLTDLRGKDVILAVVESYGQVAVQGSSFSPQVDATLVKGNQQLAAAGFAARSGFLKSSTFGGISWLAHSSVQAGVWVNSPRRYNQLIKTDRFTLSQAFKRAGWRTVDDVPSNNRFWAPGKSFYHYDKVYDRRNVGYKGPTYAYASMPDQYVMAGLQRLELAKRHRRPVFAEVDLVSSHEPWSKVPKLQPWNKLGDGSIFNKRSTRTDTGATFSNRKTARPAYALSIQYTMSTLVSWMQHYGNKNTVLVLYGDHQPWTVVSGVGASHNVPISIVAKDPAVLKRISGWGWNAGLLPSPKAPVLPMNAFRDRFLTAFGSKPTTG